MPARSPAISSTTADKLSALGQQIRAHRKSLRISVIAVSEAAGMSRVSLHRIENGEPSVAMGAYLNVMAAIGLDFGISKPVATIVDDPGVDRKGWIPVRIRLADYPQLKRLAWQLQGSDTLTPMEALSLYERNWRHVEVKALEAREQQLVDALRSGLGECGSHV